MRLDFADKKLLLVAICVVSWWTLEQITARFRLSKADCVKKLTEKDRQGYTLVLAMRRWEFEAFGQLRRWNAPAGMMSGFARPPECRTP